MAQRQQILLLYLGTSDLASHVGAWSFYDGTGKASGSSGDTDKPPYNSALHAMQDGWRVIQIAQQFPPYPGMEYATSFLKFEVVLEKMVEV